MAAILTVRGADGELIPIPAIQGEQGVSITDIVRTSGNGTPGTDDTYTIYLSNGETTTFTVHNGANGEGAGDMEARVYDPQGMAQDIFQYVLDQIAAIPTPDVSGQISAHNTSTAAHADIRTLVSNAANAASTAQSTADAAKTSAATAQSSADTAQTAANNAAAAATNAQTAANAAQTTANSKAPMYTYGTDDLTAGTSALTTGTLHFVYE